MNEPAESLDPRVLRTRRLLRQALVELVAEQDFESITVQDITDRATLNRATLYLHYQDKYDLLEDVFHEMIAGLVPLPPPQITDQDRFNAIKQVQRIIAHIAEHDAFYLALLGQRGVPAFISQVRAYIEDVISAWVSALQPDISQQPVRSDVVLSFYSSACLGVIVWWLENDMPYPSDLLTNQIVLCMMGIGPALGLRELKAMPD